MLCHTVVCVRDMETIRMILKYGCLSIYLNALNIPLVSVSNKLAKGSRYKSPTMMDAMFKPLFLHKPTGTHLPRFQVPSFMLSTRSASNESQLANSLGQASMSPFNNSSTITDTKYWPHVAKTEIKHPQWGSTRPHPRDGITPKPWWRSFH